MIGSYLDFLTMKSTYFASLDSLGLCIFWVYLNRQHCDLERPAAPFMHLYFLWMYTFLQCHQLWDTGYSYLSLSPSGTFILEDWFELILILFLYYPQYSMKPPCVDFQYPSHSETWCLLTNQIHPRKFICSWSWRWTHNRELSCQCHHFFCDLSSVFFSYQALGVYHYLF